MPSTGSGERPHLLHLHSTFDAGGKERRSTTLINRFGKAVEHSIVSAQPGALLGPLNQGHARAMRWRAVSAC